MVKKIQVPYDDEKRFFTSLIRKSSKSWEWNPCKTGEGEIRELKTIKPPIFTPEIFREYIEFFERFINSKVEEEEKTEMFLKHYKVTYYKTLHWGEKIPTYTIIIYVQNKYLKDFKYGDEEVLDHFQMDEWDDKYLGTPESWGGLSGASNLTEEMLQDYIDQLIAEYEEVTGEKYEPNAIRTPKYFRVCADWEERRRASETKEDSTQSKIK
jgi:hypothetical protein